MSADREAGGNRLVAILALAIVLPSTSQTLLVPTLPGLADEFHASAGAVAWTITGYLITASVGTPVVGRLGDQFGRRRLQLWVLGIFCAGTVICLLARSLEALVVGRMIQGCVGGVFALGIGLVRERCPPGRVGRDIGVLSAVVGVSTTAGFVIGGVVAEHFGLDALLWGQLVVAVASAVLIGRYIPAGAPSPGGRVDVPGTVLLTAVVTLPLVALSWGADWRAHAGAVAGLLAATSVLLVAWWRVERRTAQPLIDPVTLMRPTVMLANVATFFVGAAMFGLFVLTPQLAQGDPQSGHGLGLGATEAGLLLLPGGLLMLVAGPVSGVVGRRAGHQAPLAIGGSLAAVGLLALGFAEPSVPEVIAFAMVAALGVGFAFPAMPNLVVSTVRSGQVGEVAGFNALLRGFGSSVGTQVSATVLAASVVTGAGGPSADGFRIAYAVAALAGLVAAGSMVFVPRAAPRLDTVTTT